MLNRLTPFFLFPSSMVNHSSDAAVSLRFFLNRNPPKNNRIGTPDTPVSKAKAHVMVFQPAFSRIKPAKNGPTMVPAAYAELRMPYDKAMAPPLPKIFGSCASFSSTMYDASTNRGGINEAIQKPMRTNNAHNNTFWPMESCVTRRSSTMKGMVENNAPAAM